MATIAVFEPLLGPPANGTEYTQQPYALAPAAVWRRGDFLQLQTTLGSGTAILTPSGGLGSLASYAGPTFGAPVQVSSTAAQANSTGTVTVTGVVQATAPAQSYFVVLTYTATGAESQTGTEFIVNCAAGYVFSVNVATTSAPTGTTNYGAYVSLYPQYEVLQQATKTTTATGTAFAVAYPPVNSVGIARAATNQATNIVGLAVNSSLADFYSGPGGSFAVNENSLFGATNSYPPLEPAEVYLGYAVKLQFNQLVQISLVQQWTPALIGTTAGIAIQPNGFFAADNTQSNKVLTIYGSVDGVASLVGNGTETSGKRVLAYFNQGLI